MGKSRGNALLLVIILMLVLGVTLNVTARLSRNSAFKASTYQHRTAADLLAEAALLSALNEFEKDPEWELGFVDLTLGEQPGSVSMEFVSSGSTPSSDQSVNNLQGDDPVDGPRGPNSVAPGTAHLVIVAQVGPVRKVIETIVYRPRVEDFVVTDVGLVSESRTIISGDINVYGLTSMSDPTLAPAGLHANGRGSAPLDASFRWNSLVTDSAEVSGAISTSEGIIDLGSGSASVAGGISSGESRVPTTAIDIPREVDRRSSLPSGGLASGVGETTMAAGEFYVATDLDIDGDLILDDTTIYVNGNLFVNGTIKGKGSVFVDGDTTFFGDAIVSETNLEGVAVFSEGYLHLSGFNGGQFMDALSAGDPAIAAAWTKAQNDVQSIYTTQAGLGAGSDDGDDAVRDWLDAGGGSSFPALRGAMAPIPGETARFLEEKFDHLSGRFANVSDGFLEEIAEPDSQGPNGALAFLERISYDKLGYSFFQGIVYSQAGLIIDNEVEVLGSVWASGENPADPVNVDGVPVGPGDILLNRGAKIVLVSEYGTSMDEVSFGSPVTTSWLER